MTSGTYSGAAATQRVMAEEAAAAVLTPTVAVATEAAAATARKQLGFLLAPGLVFPGLQMVIFSAFLAGMAGNAVTVLASMEANSCD